MAKSDPLNLALYRLHRVFYLAIAVLAAIMLAIGAIMLIGDDPDSGIGLVWRDSIFCLLEHCIGSRLMAPAAAEPRGGFSQESSALCGSLVFRWEPCSGYMSGSRHPKTAGATVTPPSRTQWSQGKPEARTSRHPAGTILGQCARDVA